MEFTAEEQDVFDMLPEGERYLFATALALATRAAIAEHENEKLRKTVRRLARAVYTTRRRMRRESRNAVTPLADGRPVRLHGGERIVCLPPQESAGIVHLINAARPDAGGEA